MMRMAPEGWPFVVPGLALTLVLVALGSAQESRLLAGLALLAALLTAFTAWFFRDPVRAAPPGEELVLAPADGRVVQIARVEEPAFLEGSATRISIFLSIFDVHVQRAPLSGRVAHRSYRPGRYLAAWDPRASGENEQGSLGIEAGPHRVLVRQIAGLVARRVVTDHPVGAEVGRGERIGLIRFGSRVDLFLPPGWEVAREVGDRARGGLTVMARVPGGRPPSGAAHPERGP